MKNPLLLILLLLVAVVAIGDFFMPYGPFRQAPDWSPDTLVYQGVVTRQPVRRGKTVRMVVRRLPGDELVALTVVGDVLPQPADLVAFRARITVPRNAGNPGEMDYAAYQRHQGITGTAFCYRADWHTFGAASHPNLRERMLRYRQNLVDAYARHLKGDVLAIVAAMTLGDRSMLTPDIRNLYADSGASHVLALSGLHLSILYFLLSLLTVRLMGYWGRGGRVVGVVLTILLLWGFVLLAGMPLSLMRAAMMLTLYETFRLIRRRAPEYHTLMLTLILLLLYDPQQVFDTGLQLSALSVAAIITAMRHFTVYQFQRDGFPYSQTVWQKVGDAVLVFFLVSFAAQITTMPLVAHYFGRVSVVGLVSAVVVIPAAYVLIVSAVLFLLISPLRDLLAMVMENTVEGMHGVMDVISSVPSATIPVSLSWWGVTGMYVALLLIVSALESPYGFRSRAFGRLIRQRAVWAGCVVLLTCTVEEVVAYVQRPEPQIVVYNRPTRTEIHLVTADADSLVTPQSPCWVGRVIVHGGRRVAVMTERLPYGSDRSAITAITPIPVDVLLLCRGAKGHLDGYLRYYQPGWVVLDGALTDFYRRRFAEEAAVKGLAVHDVKEQGAFILPQKRQ